MVLPSSITPLSSWCCYTPDRYPELQAPLLHPFSLYRQARGANTTSNSLPYRLTVELLLMRRCKQQLDFILPPSSNHRLPALNLDLVICMTLHVLMCSMFILTNMAAAHKSLCPVEPPLSHL